jgi:proteasome lid subunit RPN8/RPN11
MEKRFFLPHDIHENLKDIYKLLPVDSLEFGGVVCGRGQKIRNFSWISSIIGSSDTFSFDANVLNYPHVHCGDNDILAVFHTHSPQVSYPSEVDRKTSKSLDINACIISPTMKKNGADYLQCFFGNENIDVMLFN